MGKESKWLSIETSPPEIGTIVLGLNESTGMRYVVETHYDVEKDCLGFHISLPEINKSIPGLNIKVSISHWMPLPEPIK